MIDTFLNVLDKLIKLAQIKSDKGKSIFDNHIEPIYKDLQIIIDDYRAILQTAREGIKNDATPITEVIVTLMERRQKYLRVRDELKSYSQVLVESRFRNDVRKYAASVLELLSVEPVTTDKFQYSDRLDNLPSPTNQDSKVKFTRISTASSSLIEDLSKLLASDRSRKGALSLIRYYDKEINKRWDDVSQNYFELRAKYLK